MSLETSHKELVVERLYQKYLLDGVIPTSDIVEEDLAIYEQEYPDYKVPTSKSVDFNIEHGSVSSASHIKKIIDTVDDDISIINREFLSVTQKGQAFYDRWIMELNRLNDKATKLEQKINSMLLLTEDTTGFFSFVSDAFVDMNLIDTALTTAVIDKKNNMVVMNSNPTVSIGSEGGGSAISLSKLTEESLTFNIISLAYGVTLLSDNTAPITNLISPNNTQWTTHIQSPKQGQMVTELKVRLSTGKNKEISSVAIGYAGPNATDKATITLQYSSNGYTWSLVPLSTATKTLTSNNSWEFPLTEMSWIKFIISKPSADRLDKASYYFDYSFKSLALQGKTFNKDRESILITKPLSTVKKDGQPVYFNKVALETCEEPQEETGIRYYVSGSRDGSTWTEWTAIAPIGSKDIGLPKEVALSGAIKRKTEDTETEKFDANTDKNKSTIVFDPASFSGTRFKDSKYAVVNTSIKVLEEEDQDILSNSIGLWRNVRAERTPSSYPDTNTVRGIPRGWGKSGGKYTCYFEIMKTDDVVIDFGNRGCEIDGQKVLGVVSVSKGIHKFSTAETNWFDISRSSDGIVLNPISITSVEDLKKADPLYPSNHKLLIEGYPYNSNFSGEQKYKGTDISAEFYGTRSSHFDLENTSTSYSDFSVKSVGTKENKALGVIIKKDTSIADTENELFSVVWKSGHTSSAMYKQVKLKASLTTTNIKKTPKLSSYRIKLGL